ncbi:hypothetical protein BS47DRAFT_1336487 [Hydnum rufescens UP504]|uniref:N-acetyltransferase domain-containing protein n=1 Tax=Hydnum rufescens UP504 TaxID=1448309 RepID=A0A9P6B8L9_9AGAM|nr:hypothetical protein BS47DRAFT_1336487 [Hydnum rufescens UP504]
MPIEPLHEVVFANSSELIAQCFELRVSVFVHEQEYPLEVEADEHDNEPTTVHFLLCLLPSKEPIGTIRFYPIPSHSDSDNITKGGSSPPAWKLGRLCVLKSYRKYGLGSALLAAGHAWLRGIAVERRALEREVGVEDSSRPLAEIFLASQIHAIGFYIRNGYEVYGEEFIVDGQPHRAMKLSLYSEGEQTLDQNH